MNIFDQIRNALHEEDRKIYQNRRERPRLAVLVGYEAFDELIIDARFVEQHKISRGFEDLTFDGQPLHRVISTKVRFQIVEVLS